MHKSNLKFLSVLALGLSLNFSVSHTTMAMEDDLNQSISSGVLRVHNSTQEVKGAHIDFAIHHPKCGLVFEGAPQLANVSLTLQPDESQDIAEKDVLKG